MGQFDPENNRRVKVGILAILIHWKASHFFRYMSRTTRPGILKQTSRTTIYVYHKKMHVKK
ncbi:hypothetical protein T09_1708 [Trichinella sp. T9]|nr:hypothetical protein T09_1708 [Trichinella sp. T9]